MDLQELRKRAAAEAGVESFPIDQCRRRVNALVAARAFAGRKIPTEKNRWDYGEEAVEILTLVLRLEKTGLSAKDAIRQAAENKLGQPLRDAAEIEAENRELRDALRRRDEELRRMQEKLKLREERLLPVERSPVRAFFAKLWRFLSTPPQ